MYSNDFAQAAIQFSFKAKSFQVHPLFTREILPSLRDQHCKNVSPFFVKNIPNHVHSDDTTQPVF